MDDHGALDIINHEICTGQATSTAVSSRPASRLVEARSPACKGGVVHFMLAEVLCESEMIGTILTYEMACGTLVRGIGSRVRLLISR